MLVKFVWMKIVWFILYCACFVSCTMYVCSEDLTSVDKLIKARYDILCNLTTTDCFLKDHLYHFIIVLHDGGQWPILRQFAHLLSSCNIRHMVINVINIDIKYIPKCSLMTTVVVYSLTNLVINSHQGIDDFSCSVVSPTVYPLLDIISSTCVNTLWLTGSNKCDDKIITSANKVLKYKSNNNALLDSTFEKYYIRNKHLVVGVKVFEPYITKTKLDSGNVIYGGALIELVGKIASNLQFTYTVTEPPDEFYGGLVNGSWNGLVRQLIMNETDMAVADFTATYERSQAIDFSSSFFFETIGILVRESGSESKLWNMFLLFTVEVWLTIFGCAVFSICFLHLLHKFSAIPYDCKFNKFGNCTWFVVSCLTNQGTKDEDHESWSAQNYMAFWWLSVFAVLSAYSGGLMAMLTIGRRILPFKDLNGLLEHVQQGTYKACIERNTAFHSAIEAGEYGPLKQFLEQNPSYATTADICPELLMNEDNVAYVNEVSALTDVQKRYCKEHTLIILNDRFFPGFFAFGFNKNSPYKTIISQQITSAVDGGLIEGWKIKFTNELIICNLYKPDDLIEPSTNALTLAEITGPFVLFCVGFIISFFIFFMELALQQFLKRTEKLTVYPKIGQKTVKKPLRHRNRNSRYHQQKAPHITND